MECRSRTGIPLHPSKNHIMKRFTHILIYILTISLSLALLYSCMDSKAHTQFYSAYDAHNIPELLERNAGLGSPEERQNSLNIYAGLKNELKKDHMNIDARLKLIQLFMLEARVGGEHGYYYPKALEQIEIILSFSPPKEDRFYALSLKSAILLSLHKFPQAMAVATEARELNPYNAQIHGALVDAFVELGDYKSAVETSDKMVSLRPDLRSYARVSYLREIHGDVEGAIEAMQRAVQAAYPGYEESAWCRLTLGNLYENYGRIEEARMQYEQILKERTDYPFAIAALGDLAAKEGKYEEAKELLEKASTFIPEFSFYESLIGVYAELGMEEKANSTLEEVLLMLEDDTEKGHNMGMEFARLYLEELKDYDKALSYALEEARSRPENIDINKLLAAIYYKKGQWELAQNHIEKAGITQSNDPEFLALKGLIMRENGDKEDAKQLLKKALDSNPFLPEIWLEEIEG